MRRGLVVLCLFALSGLGPVWADRFPQPVRAGDLIGRNFIGATEAQTLLGTVEGVEAGGLRVRRWSWWPWRRDSVDVPLAAVALLGEHVALVGLTPAQFQALPLAGPAAVDSPDTTVRIGLARPFH